jgi:hypothetical protein
METRLQKSCRKAPIYPANQWLVTDAITQPPVFYPSGKKKNLGLRPVREMYDAPTVATPDSQGRNFSKQALQLNQVSQNPHRSSPGPWAQGHPCFPF